MLVPHDSPAAAAAAAAALASPGHSIYLASTRLDVQTLVICAQTSIIAAAPSSLAAQPTASPAAARSPCPSSGAAAKRASQLESQPQVGAGRTPRLRPRSVELGSRAREALLDIGRAARELRHGGTSRSRIDEAAAAASASAASHTQLPNVFLDAQPRARDETDPDERARERASAAASLEGRQAVADQVVRVRRVLRIRPRQGTPQVGAMRAAVFSRLESDDASGLWARLDAPPCELVADEEPATAAECSMAGRAGRFQPSDAASDAGSESDDEEEEGALDPDRMLFKLEPPAAAARTRWAAHSSALDAGTVEQHDVIVRVRLRLSPPTPASIYSSATHQRTPSGPRPRRTSQGAPPSAYPNMAQSPRLRPSSGSRQLVFIAAPSSAQLVRALESDEPRNVEGVHCSVVQEPGREQDFEWGWSPSALTQSRGKYACAFVEREERTGACTLLASFAFFVELPKSSASLSSSGQTEATSAPAAVSTFSYQLSNHSSASHSFADLRGSSDPLAVRARRISGSFGSNTPATPADTRANFAFPSVQPAQPPASASAEVRPMRLELDQTEISLKDVADDSPVFRAALQNLERKTATLRKTAKTVIRATADVQAQLSASRAAQAALDEAMQELCFSAPGSVAVLMRDFLSEARARARAQEEDEARMLFECIERPLRGVLETCRATQEQHKTFEHESRTYYSQTQKWLSSRATPAAEPDTTYAASAIGFDKSAVKQDRLDEKQKLRQARFDLARLEIFRASARLHGGETELHLASKALELCAWHAKRPAGGDAGSWPTTDAKTLLSSFKLGLAAAAEDFQTRDIEMRERIAELQARIAQLESSLGKVGDDGDSGKGAGSDELALSAVTRQAGNKIKTMISSLGGIGSPSSASLSSAALVPSASMNSTTGSSGPDGETESGVAETPTKPGTGQRLRHTVSLKLSGGASGPNGVSTPVFGALQRLRNSHHSTGPNDERRGSVPSAAVSLDGEYVEVSPTRTRMASAPLAENMPVNPFEPMQARSPASPRRALSQSSTQASPMGRARPVFPNHRSPMTTDRQSPGIKRSASDCARLGELSPRGLPTRSASGLGIGGVTLLVDEPEDAKTPMPFPRNVTRSGNLSPVVAPGLERKKEGLLWVLSKPIAGACGSDAPRGVNRATHWREAWVVLSGSGHLGEYAAWRESKILEPSQPLIDLRFATVREGRGVERRFTFEVVTRDSRRFFQAPDEAGMRSWMAAIGRAIESLLNGTSSVRHVEKVARSVDIGAMSPDDFGASGLRAFGGATPASGKDGLGQSRAFSQSLTDLSSAASARLFNRMSDSHRTSKRDQRHGAAGGGHSEHLSTLTESMPGSAGLVPQTPTRHAGFERGISNKTPVSGYVADGGFGQPTSGPITMLPAALRSQTHLARRQGTEISDSNSSWSEIESEYDVRIAEAVHNSYGGSSAMTRAGASSNGSSAFSHRRSGTADSPIMSRQTSATGSNGHVRQRIERINSSNSTKVTRAAEVARISRLPENASCADCRAPGT
jgi:hypothetical protein